ncbi:MAG TPA: thioredoxin-disulfide reductase [Chloroflexota bacterium]|nr:thioredoxin-disulfide reductase [Chloroflexota bacterium]
MPVHEVIILGSGPAGLTAAIYAARADLHPIVIAGRQSGGQLMLTSEVENFPGFPEGVMGPELMDRMRQQAEKFGAEFVDEDASGVDFRGKPLAVVAEDTRYEARAVIIATGASARWLGLPSEARLMGRGVSSCATCDGFFFRNKDVAVVGGGDTALEEAIFLTKFARSVALIHRRKELRGSKIMQDRADNNPKIRFVWESVVCDVLGSDHVQGVTIENVDSKKTSELAVDGLFVAIGYTPNTKILEGQVELDEKGYVKVYDQTRTNVEGVFVAGDVEDYHYRQAITAAGAGCRAAMDAEVFIEGVA